MTTQDEDNIQTIEAEDKIITINLSMDLLEKVEEQKDYITTLKEDRDFWQGQSKISQEFLVRMSA